MQVIGFFGNLLQQFGALWEFVSKPLGQLNDKITMEPFASASIMSLFSISLLGTLGILLTIHLIRLFVGG